VSDTFFVLERAVCARSLELDRVMLDVKAGPRLNASLTEAEIGVVEVCGMTALTAHDVMMVRPGGPLEAAPALTPVDPVDHSLAF
jgi:hypothetical protein